MGKKKDLYFQLYQVEEWGDLSWWEIEKKSDLILLCVKNELKTLLKVLSQAFYSPKLVVWKSICTVKVPVLKSSILH